MWDWACEMSNLPFASLQSGSHLSAFSMFYYFFILSALPPYQARQPPLHASPPAGRAPTCARAPSAGLLGTWPTQTPASPLAGRRRPPTHASPGACRSELAQTPRPRKLAPVHIHGSHPCSPAPLLAVVEPCQHGKRAEELHLRCRPAGPRHSSAEEAEELQPPVGRPRPPLDAGPSPSLSPPSRGRIRVASPCPASPARRCRGDERERDGRGGAARPRGEPAQEGDRSGDGRRGELRHRKSWGRRREKKSRRRRWRLTDGPTQRVKWTFHMPGPTCQGL
jgi:hypothetical protein